MGATRAQRRAIEARDSDLNRQVITVVRDLMHNRGATQVGLADFLEVSQPTVARWLNQRVALPTTELPRIATFLGVDTADIYAAAAADSRGVA
jgi:transcriptional regulator with XRE-family HTH domain